MRDIEKIQVIVGITITTIAFMISLKVAGVMLIATLIVLFTELKIEKSSNQQEIDALLNIRVIVLLLCLSLLITIAVNFKNS